MAKETRQLIATLEEKTTLSFGGNAAFILLLIFQICIFAAFGSVNGAIQEVVVGTVWIAGNVLLGICVLAGRRSTYRVLREPEAVLSKPE